MQLIERDYIRQEVKSAREHISKESVIQAVKIQSAIRKYATDFLRDEGFLEIPPVIISPLTDPLNHPVLDPKISAYGSDFWLTKSMIFHKQIAVQSLKKIFIVSPNIRLEIGDKSETGRHLYEFTQIDVESLMATREEIMEIAEGLICSTIEKLILFHKKELDFFERVLHVPKRPFKTKKYLDALEEYGKDFERKISEEATEPVWIIDIPLQEREFYDREHEDQPGVLRDMDLIWPEGYQEAISGGEREYRIDRILERIRKKEQTEEQFKWFIELARLGIDMSCGFGIGVERFTRYICGLKRIEYVTPFPKTPGKVCL